MTLVRIRKALQIKNRITGEIANLNKLIQSHNSHQDGAGRFDVAKLLIDRVQAVEKLVAIKTAISNANVAIYEKIARMAELKAEIAFYRSLNTTEGLQNSGYGDRAVLQIKIVATVNAAQVEDIVKACTLAIEKLQDEVDYFNSATEIVVPD